MCITVCDLGTPGVLALQWPLGALRSFPGYTWPPEDAYSTTTSLLPPLTPCSSVDLHPAAFSCGREITWNGKSITKGSSTLVLKMSLLVGAERAVHQFIRLALPLHEF